MTTPISPTLFPTEITSNSYRRRRRIRRAVTAAVVVVVLAGGGLAVAQTTGSAPTQYRLASAGQQQVTSTLDGVATIQPVAQADVAFPNDGTVTSVSVAVGDTVTAGQALAQQDTADLLVTVRSKEAALDKANLILAEAVAGNDVSSLVGGSAGRSFLLTDAVVQRMLAALPAADTSGLPAARQAVASAQHAVDSALADASAALASATSVCAAIGVDPTSTDPSAITSAVDACQSALNTVVTKQNAVKAAQNDLADASSALDSLLSQIADDVTNTTAPATTEPATTAPTTQPTTTEPTTATTQPSGATTTTEPTTASSTPTDESAPTSTETGGSRSGGGGFGGSSGSGRSSGGGGASTSKTPTASDIASYQRAVDAAQSALDVADLAVGQATITSPIDGTVIAVNIAAGATVSGGSTTETIVIQGAGGYEATTTVSLAHVAEVKVGATATVLPDGASQTYSGKVVSVSQVPSTSSGGTSTFGVAIALDGDTSALHNGGIGSVAIVTGTSAAALAVPTSAVTTEGTVHTVEVYDGTTVTTTRVEVGVIGPVWTEITSGLTEGQQVVLAQLDKALPTSATSASNGSNTRTFTVNGRTVTFPGGGANRP